MGYEAGTGLGKNAQGRVDIVEASRQKGTRGLGSAATGFEQADVQWDFEKEEVSFTLCCLFSSHLDTYTDGKEERIA